MIEKVMIFYGTVGLVFLSMGVVQYTLERRPLPWRVAFVLMFFWPVVVGRILKDR